ncbi:hypothetical protein P3G55_01735 [Leptospira sp. 96542]|nr:hypothetical protein [Leptospira sp. 96542]
MLAKKVFTKSELMIRIVWILCIIYKKFIHVNGFRKQKSAANF